MSDRLEEMVLALAESHAHLKQQFARLAKAIAEVEAEEPGRDPVPYKDYLPGGEDDWYRQKAHEDDDHTSCLGGCEAEADRLVSKVLDGGAA